LEYRPKRFTTKYLCAAVWRNKRINKCISLQPSGLSRLDGKRPDGIPWRAGRSLIWDVTVSCTTADCYLEASSREAGAAAELAASNKMVKYAGLSSQGEFVPIAVESNGPINRDALQFLTELGRRLAETTGDVRAFSFLFQRISVVVQRFNSVLLHDGFVDDDRPEMKNFA